MNIIKLIKPLIFTILVFVFALNSSAGKVRITPAKDVRQIIKESIRYPEFAWKNGYQGSVEVLFMIQPDGYLKVRKVYTEDKALAAYIEKEFSRVCCNDLRTPINQHFKVKLTFKLVG